MEGLLYNSTEIWDVSKKVICCTAVCSLLVGIISSKLYFVN
jgi:hypothetical protein